VARTWTDEAFKKELLADPERVLAANGITVPAGTNVQIHEDSATVNHLVLPLKPANLNVSDFSASDWCDILTLCL
jgi:hypothetical protein